MPDTEVPTAPTGLQTRPGLVFGVIGALAAGLLSLIGIGGLNDGFQWGDVGIILSPLLVGLASGQAMFSQKTADIMASRADQRAAVEYTKRS